MYVGRLVDMNKSIHVSMCASYMYICMYIYMEVRIHMYVGKHA